MRKSSHEKHRHVRTIARGAAGAALALMALLSAPNVSAAGFLAVQKVVLSSSKAGSAEVRVTTDGKPTYTARVAQGGLRLLVDISGAEVAGAEAAILKGNDVVSGVMTQAYESAGQKTTRVLVQLAKTAEYAIFADATGLRIELTAAAQTKAREAPHGKAASGDGQIDNVHFKHGDESDEITIDTHGSPTFTELTSEGTKAYFEITGATMQDALQKKIDTSAFGGPIQSVSVFRRVSDPSKIVVEVERAGEGAKGTISRGKDSILLSFSASASASSAATETPAAATTTSATPSGRPISKTIAVEDDLRSEVPRVEQTFSFAAGVVESVTQSDEADAFLPMFAGQQQRRFSGRRVDLDLRDADIHNVLRFLSDIGKVNIVTADTVTGNVTIRLRNVPWDQALETILQAKGLGMVRQGNMIRVALLADLNKERELALARRKAELQLAPIETRIISVSYASAKDLQERAKDMLSPRGSIAVDERTNVLIARDVAGNLNQIEELVHSLDTQTPQVLIEARIVEATSRYSRDIGIQWGGDATFGPATGNPTGLAFPSSIGVVGGASDTTTPTQGLSPFSPSVANPNFAVNLPAIVGTDTGGALGFTFGSINNTVNLAVRLSAAEASGLLRIVSSPRILTLDNRDARISQGTLIPFSQISAQGVQTTFQEAKLSLIVKPHVTADGSVSMHVKINRDEPDFNQTSARGDPTILKREAETDLLVMDGHTAVIGGIFTRNTGRNLDQVPLLGDIPIIGVLFQRRRSNDNRSELVIFLTPRIVNRAEALGH